MDDTEESINIQTRKLQVIALDVKAQIYRILIFARKVSVYRVVLVEVMNFVANVNAAMQICVQTRQWFVQQLKESGFNVVVSSATINCDMKHCCYQK